MSRAKRSFSCNDLKTTKLKVIEDLLDKTAPTLIPLKTRAFRKRYESADYTDSCNNNNLEQQETIDYYPNLDATIWLRSCEKEVVEPITGIITGRIPNWLSGCLLRNGPGCLKVGDYKYEHLFDSSALLHRFEIKNGNVTYQNRFVKTDIFKKNRAANRIIMTEFGTRAVPDPCQSIFSKISSFFKPTGEPDNTMISVYPFEDEYYTFTEFPTIHRIDPKTLETLGKVNIAKYVSIVSHTSHPHVMTDGTIYNLGMTVTNRGPAYAIVKFSPSVFTEENGAKKRKLSMFEQAKIVSTLPPRWTFNPSYMHTFGITENYFIIVEQPLSLGLKSVIMRKIRDDPLCAAFRWFGNENTHIYLLSRETGKLVKTFAAEAFFFLHIINQYETKDGNSVILDICCYRDPKMLDCMYIEAIENVHTNPDYCKLFRGRPLRFILPLKTPNSDIPPNVNLLEANNVQGKSNDCFKEKIVKTDNATFDDNNNSTDDVMQRKSKAFKLSNGKIFVVPELLCDMGCETPRINYESNLGKEYRYFYAICSDVDRDNAGMLVKVDTKLKTKLIWCERNVYPSEPIFVPNPQGKNEDDGVVLSALLWGQERVTHVGLLILNAVTFEEVGRATFKSSGPVPKCLHGWFSSDLG